MKRKKVLVVTGTRAEYGLLRSTMDAIRKDKRLTLSVLVTGMHTLRKYGNTQMEVKRNGYPIVATVPVREKDEQYQALAKETKGIGDFLARSLPDCVLVLGDRDEPLAAAIAAAHLNIPIAHIHGGDVTGTGVDENIRHAITKFAHLHFPATAQSAMRLKALGEESWRITTVGTPGLDGLRVQRSAPRRNVARELGLDVSRPWMVIVQHPTPFDKTPLQMQIREVLNAIACFPDHEKIIVYPNSDTGSNLFLKAISGLRGKRYHVFPSLPRERYASVIAQSEVLVGNSSSGIIEAAFLGTPTVDIGNRQKGRECGQSVITAPYNTVAIEKAIRRSVALKRKQGGRAFISPYGEGKAGEKIARILATKLSKPNLLWKLPPGGW